MQINDVPSNSTTLELIDGMISVLQDRRDEWKKEFTNSNDEVFREKMDALLKQTTITITNLCILGNWLDPEI
jgi:hypothetical protein